MDISSLIGTLMSADSVQNIGKTTKTNDNDTANVLKSALPLLFNGAQTQSRESSNGFAEALLFHGKNDASDLSSFMGNVDLDDGSKILGHLFGNDSSSQISSIAKASGAKKTDVSKILAAAAPLLMTLLGKQFASSAKKSSSTDIGDIASMLFQNVDLGGIFGGKTTAQKEESSPLGAIGDILGNLLK